MSAHTRTRSQRRRGRSCLTCHPEVGHDGEPGAEENGDGGGHEDGAGGARHARPRRHRVRQRASHTPSSTRSLKHTGRRLEFSHRQAGVRIFFMLASKF